MNKTYIICQKRNTIGTTNIIKSISYNQDEILQGILKLYCNNARTFKVDPCFGNGCFYKKIPLPSMIFDINPQQGNVKKANSNNLSSWFKDNECNNIIFDPPFMFGVHGKTLNNIFAKRFTMFNNFDELKSMYKTSLKEFYRILKPNGILIFKCQDYTDTKTTMTHCLVYNWAIESGFYAEDLFILLAKARIYNPNMKQRHARKFHCYFWIFKKVKK